MGSLYRHQDGFQILIGWHTWAIRGVNLKTKISHEYGAFIIENNLRRNFLLHLLNLVDHCLLKPSKVPEIMEIIDKGKGKTNPDFTGAREEKEKLEKIINDSTARDYNY